MKTSGDGSRINLDEATPLASSLFFHPRLSFSSSFFSSSFFFSFVHGIQRHVHPRRSLDEHRVARVVRSVGFGTRENKDPREGAGYYNFDQQLWRKRIGGRRRRYRQLSRSITRGDERNEREGRSVCELWQVFDNVEAAPPKLRVFACCEGERDVEFIVHGVSSSILLPPSIAFKVNNVIVLLNRIVEVVYADSSSKYNCYTFVSL